jgi:DNA-directed RNA polymerase subunit E'/Rpb7
MKFPPLYECSVCGCAVKVTPTDGEPIKQFSCDHTDAIIYANRKAVLYAEGDLNVAQKAAVRFTVTVRQLLSAMTGRSV